MIPYNTKNLSGLLAAATLGLASADAAELPVVLDPSCTETSVGDN
jgi:hypothetical protein